MKSKRIQIMKTKNTEFSFDILKDFALTNEEMNAVRGGGTDYTPDSNPTSPPIKI
jgi:hypothetical protein